MNYLEELKEYFNNTSKEKILEDWNKSEYLNNIGPTVSDYLCSLNQLLPNLKQKKWDYRKMNKKKSLRQKD